MTSEGNAAADTILTLLVKAANASVEPIRNGIGVTLTVGGSLVSGQIIPHWQWFEENEKTIRSQDPADLPEENSFGYLFGYVRSGVLSRRDDQQKINEMIEKLPESVREYITVDDRTDHIHLANTRFFQAGFGGIPANGMLWRGRLREVSGWSLGLLTPNSGSKQPS